MPCICRAWPGRKCLRDRGKRKTFGVEAAHLAVAIDLDSFTTGVVDDVDLGRRRIGLQDFFTAVPCAVAVAVMEDEPAAAPFFGGGGQAAAVGVVGVILLDTYAATAFHGFRARVVERGLHGLYGLLYAPAFNERLKAWGGQGHQEGQNAEHRQKLNGAQAGAVCHPF